MDGRRVRCLARRPDVLKGRVAVSTEVVAGDVLNPSSLLPSLQGIEVAYYLVHSMGSSGALEEDRRGASHVGRAAREAGVRLVFAGMLRGSVAAIGATPRGRAAAPEREQTL
jgi:uncharacterized protein YbjT (DUF2867 family)